MGWIIHRIELKNKVSKKRIELSKKLNIPAYAIFKNKTIFALIDQLAKSKEDLLKVYGISDKNSEKFGDDILSVVLKFTNRSLKPEKPTFIFLLY
jgi:superfamily II DNA helicase RecQ